MPRLHVSDIHMHYERVGKGPPLLITTGWARAERAFLHHRELLADEFDCIRHDHRGIGASDAPDDAYTIEAMADDLAGLLDGLRIPRCRVLGGVAWEHWSCPTLVTSGSEQDLITGPRFAYEVHHAIPNSKLHLFERTSHNHWVERFDEWWTVTRDFFRVHGDT